MRSLSATRIAPYAILNVTQAEWDAEQMSVPFEWIRTASYATFKLHQFIKAVALAA